MRKISGQLLSSKPVSLSRAAKLISRFAAVDNGSSATISLYLQRTADAFNHLVQLHNKRPKTRDAHKIPERERAHKLETNSLEKHPDEKSAKDSKKIGKRDKRTVVEETAGANPNEGEVKDLETEEKEESKEETQKKKKKKRKLDGDDEFKEESIKKRRLEGHQDS